MVCRAKESGKVIRRGKPSIEWYKNGKPQYYCCGYIDARTDEALPECKECRQHVDKAQDDLEAWNRRAE
nr:MAG TPA: His-Me finger endonuclease beta4-alpha2 domain [Caudoviricetes sp.]